MEKISRRKEIQSQDQTNNEEIRDEILKSQTLKDQIPLLIHEPQKFHECQEFQNYL